MPVFNGCNKLDSGMREHWKSWGRVSWTWKGGWKIDDEVWSFHSNKGFLTWMQAHLQTNHGGTNVHAQWISHQKNGADDHDITMWHHKSLSCCKREGTIKGEHDQTSGLLLLSSGCHGTRHLGPLTSHRPSTLAVSVLLVERAYPEWTLLLVCSYACIQTLLEDFS